MHILNFLGVSLINSFEQHGVGSVTLTRIPASSYRFNVSFSFWRFETGTRCTGMLTGVTLLSTLKDMDGPKQPNA